MKIVKRTKQFYYVALGGKDMEDVFTSSDLIRVERNDIDKGYVSLTDKVKCDSEFEEIDYPSDWVVLDGFDYKFQLPNDVDKVVEEEQLI